MERGITRSDLWVNHIILHFNRKALTEADLLLRLKHGMVRLDSVWGIVGGRRPVKQLVKKVRMNSYCLSVSASNTAAVLGFKLIPCCIPVKMGVEARNYF